MLTSQFSQIIFILNNYQSDVARHKEYDWPVIVGKIRLLLHNTIHSNKVQQNEENIPLRLINKSLKPCIR